MPANLLGRPLGARRDRVRGLVRSASRRGHLVCGLLVGASVLCGCDVSQLQFVNDDRLTFEQPRTSQKVSIPLTVRWAMKDFQAVGLDGSSDDGRGAFAVFVDRAPMPVGRDLRWLARADPDCNRDPRCPDATYLRARGVYVTTEPSLSLDTLPAVHTKESVEQHYVNVVLIDGTGKRIGESAWYRQFTTKRRQA